MCALSLWEISRIAAFLPDYREGVGQGVLIYYCDGTTHWLSRGLRSFIAKIAKLFAVSLKDMRRKYGPAIGQANLAPLVFSPFLLFVPIKVRTPLVSGDPAYGYFRLSFIQTVSQKPEPCSLMMEGSNRLTVRQSFQAVCARLHACASLERTIINDFWRTMDIKQHYFYLHSFMSDSFLQENQNAYGIKGVENEKGVSFMELRNLMEILVVRRLDEVLDDEKEEVCRCNQCRMDMAALALNDLTPRYVVTQRGETYSKADLLEVQRFVDVLTAISKAVKIVHNNPRH